MRSPYRQRGVPITVEWLEIQTITDNNGCWIWQRCIGTCGYGYIHWNGHRAMKVHRLIWMLIHGPIPDGLNICHHCDVRACINPDHLYAGTQRQNVMDAVARGRSRGAPGEQNSLHKLTESDVLFIRQSTMKATELAALFGVERGSIHKVRRRATWKHI